MEDATAADYKPPPWTTEGEPTLKERDKLVRERGTFGQDRSFISLVAVFDFSGR